MKKLPTLKADTMTLFDLYHNNVNVSAKEIKQSFKVCDSTATKVIHRVMEYMEEQAIPQYTYKLEVPVTVLFSVYGWDIKQINKSAKILQSFS